MGEGRGENDSCGRMGQMRIGESHSWWEKWRWGSNNRRRDADAGLGGTECIPRDLESKQRGSRNECMCVSHWIEGHSWTWRETKENFAFSFREEMYREWLRVCTVNQTSFLLNLCSTISTTLGDLTPPEKLVFFSSKMEIMASTTEVMVMIKLENAS